MRLNPNSPVVAVAIRAMIDVPKMIPNSGPKAIAKRTKAPPKAPAIKRPVESDAAVNKVEGIELSAAIPPTVIA